VTKLKSLSRLLLATQIAIAASNPSFADDRLKEAARSMHEGITRGAPLVAERRTTASPEKVRAGQSAEARLNVRLSRAPALDAIEDIYIGCIVRHALVYSIATKEPSASVADASVVMCDSERAGLVKGYRLALWSVMNVSVAHADSPSFGRAAKARVDLIDRSIGRIVSARIIHMRAMEALSRDGREPTSRYRSEQASTATDGGETRLEWRIRSIVEQL
jgi:hypothetical protein